MAATIAECEGQDSSRTKRKHRLGSISATARANTWRTFTTCFVRRDGGGYIRVERDGKEIHYFEFPPENAE